MGEGSRKFKKCPYVRASVRACVRASESEMLISRDEKWSGKSGFLGNVSGMDDRMSKCDFEECSANVLGV